MTRLLKIGAVLGLLTACPVAWTRLHGANARLREQVAEVRTQSEQTVRLREQNQRLQVLMERAQRDQGDALRAVRLEAVQAREEVAELEQRAEERAAAKRAKDTAAAAVLNANRDLTKGPVLIEHCDNAGRGTPVAALQTYVWASMHGDEDVLGRAISLSGAARMLTEGLLATQSESARREFSTPEKAVGLIFAEMVMDLTTVQVLGQKMEDPAHVTLTVARRSGKTVELPMQLGADGWQIVASEGMLSKHLKARFGIGAPAAKK